MGRRRVNELTNICGLYGKIQFPAILMLYIAVQMPIFKKKGYSMRKIIISLLFSGLVCAGAVSETVMLYIGNGAETEEQFQVCLPVSLALEDGVMNEFFDSGHIVFNAGISMDREFPDTPFPADRLPLRAAKAGGAAYLLEVTINYTFQGGEDGEIGMDNSFSADYIFSQVSSSRVLRTGGVTTAAVTGIESPEPEKYSYVLGQMIAREALSIW